MKTSHLGIDGQVLIETLIGVLVIVGITGGVLWIFFQSAQKLLCTYSAFQNGHRTLIGQSLMPLPRVELQIFESPTDVQVEARCGSHVTALKFNRIESKDFSPFR